MVVKRHSHLLITAKVLTDLAVTALAWIGAYLLRFHAGWFALPLGEDGLTVIAPLMIYLQALPVVLFLALVIYQKAGLYVPRREGRLLVEAWRILQATVTLFLMVSAFAYFYDRNLFSRLLLMLFPGVCLTGMLAGRIGLRMLVRRLRERGYNHRRALIVGSGKLGRQVGQALEGHPWLGIGVVGYLSERVERVGETVGQTPIVGSYDDVTAAIAEHRADQVFLALPWRQLPQLDRVLGRLDQEVVDIRVVPDVRAFATLNHGISELDGLPLIALRESPLVGWNRLIKRVTDIALACLALLMLGLPMMLIAFLVKLGSTGPVFYRQRRMGLDGQEFEILKFRSMVEGAEQQTGAVWASAEDPRRTRLGTFLRRSNLDELPQLFNVLRGEMSLVGPRPERPVFVEKFKKMIPRYMLRHKMKAGITGWAQINGWRGNTSLRKRIQYDLYYIENWSLWFDLRILFMTLFRGPWAKDAY